MTTKLDEGDHKVARETGHETSPPPPGYTDENASVQTDQAFVYDDSQKLGYTATVFVILNKMIGTGSESTTSTSTKHCLQDPQSSPPPLVSSQFPAQWVFRFSCGSLVVS